MYPLIFVRAAFHTAARSIRHPNKILPQALKYVRRQAFYLFWKSQAAARIFPLKCVVPQWLRSQAIHWPQPSQLSAQIQNTSNMIVCFQPCHVFLFSSVFLCAREFVHLFKVMETQLRHTILNIWLRLVEPVGYRVWGWVITEMSLLNFKT